MAAPQGKLALRPYDARQYNRGSGRPRLPAVRAPIATTAALLAVLLGGCGGDGAHRGASPATLALDFTPNAVHAPIYAAAR